VRFVSALDLEGALDLAREATSLVLDDLGEELMGAPLGGGLVAQRVAAVVRLVRARYDKKLGLVITTGHDLKGTPEKPGLEDLYGDANMRRVFEGVELVTLGAGAGTLGAPR
jgi:hypothetical protein